MKIRFLVAGLLAALFSIHASADHGKLHWRNKSVAKADPKAQPSDPKAQAKPAEKEKPTGSLGSKLKKQVKK